jgi:creatinine amidohydrolase
MIWAATASIAIANFVPLMAELARDSYRQLSPLGPGRLAWQAQDLNPAGACGDATDADAERGRQLVEHAARVLIELLAEVDRYPLANLRADPTREPPKP